MKRTVALLLGLMLVLGFALVACGEEGTTDDAAADGAAGGAVDWTEAADYETQQATITGTVFLSAFTTKTAVYALARAFPGTEQLIFIGAVLAVWIGLSRVQWPEWAWRVLVYTIGSLAAFWTIERLAGFLA